MPSIKAHKEPNFSGTKFDLLTNSRDEFLKWIEQLNPERIDSAQELFWDKQEKAKRALKKSNHFRNKHFWGGDVLNQGQGKLSINKGWYSNFDLESSFRDGN